MMSRIVVLEGADGTGKGTQLELLKDELLKREVKFTTFDFPRYKTFWGKMVSRYLAGEFGDYKEISPYLKSMFYLLDQSDASKQIKKDLEDGNLIICNRYSTSQVFQAVGFDDLPERDQFWDWVEQAAYKELDIVRPDIVIGLYADPKVSFSNIELKGKREYTDEKRDMNEKNFSLQEKVAEEIKRICQKEDTWHLVEVTDGGKMRDKNEIAKDIIDIIL